MASHRTLIAAAVTLAALCGLAGFALGAGSGEDHSGHGSDDD